MDIDIHENIEIVAYRQSEGTVSSLDIWITSLMIRFLNIDV